MYFIFHLYLLTQYLFHCLHPDILHFPLIFKTYSSIPLNLCFIYIIFKVEYQLQSKMERLPVQKMYLVYIHFHLQKQFNYHEFKFNQNTSILILLLNIHLLPFKLWYKMYFIHLLFLFYCLKLIPFLSYDK